MKFGLAAIVGVVAAAAASSAYCAGPVSANTTAAANIVAAQQLTATQSLDFGTIAKPISGISTVTLAPTGAASQTPTVTGTAFVPIPGQGRAAIFHMLGTNGQTYSVTQPTLSFTSQAGNLSNIVTSFATASGSTTALPANGQDDLFVAAKMDIDVNTAVQAYTGTVAVTVTFN